MIIQEMNEKDQLWNRLQEPARPVNQPTAYLLLLAALDTGWHVLEPVLFNTDWGKDSKPVYHFLLHRYPSMEIRQLTVPTSPEIDQFVREEGFLVAKVNLSQCAGMPLYLS